MIAIAGMLVIALVCWAIGTVKLRGLLMAVSAVTILVSGGIAYIHISHSTAPDQLDPHPLSRHHFVALGDSYISGEGARRYFSGTDVGSASRRNTCHRAPTAYPWEVAQELVASLTFIACSGARTWHVTGKDALGKNIKGQHPASPPEVYGALPQIESMRDVERPDVVLISIGGNDAGFAEIGAGCALPRRQCLSRAQSWLDALKSKVGPALQTTYSAVREAAKSANKDIEVFALTYPQPFGVYNKALCGYLPIQAGEVKFIRERLLPTLNDHIRQAAARSRVRVIDLEDSLKGHRICEKHAWNAALNFVALGRTSGEEVTADIGQLGRGTFHPNALGHDLMGATVRQTLQKWANNELGSLPSRPERPQVLEATSEHLASPLRFPPGTACTGATVARLGTGSLPADADSFRLRELRRGSLVCYRNPSAAAWNTARVDDEGTVNIPIDLSSDARLRITEILAQRTDRQWDKVVVTPIVSDPDTDTDPPKPKPAAVLDAYGISDLVLDGVIVAVVAGFIATAARWGLHWWRRRRRDTASYPPP